METTVGKILEEVIDTVCNCYCKFPEEYARKYENETDAEEFLYKEKCDKCILNKL